MNKLLQTPDTTLKRRPQRGSFDRATINAILDEAFICHVGFVANDRPFVIPTSYVRIADRLLIHGSAFSRMQLSLAEGISACVTVTLIRTILPFRGSNLY
jgi:nitroimidazol reductase NimA-like FMN-containing flavoprotein (pyridoxamine 5'-phosphate oxidase superfamily)